MFALDIDANKDTLIKEIKGKSLLVIGGAGSIGASYIHAILPFKPSKLVVIDLNENGLAELTRDLRSTCGMYIPEEYRTYTLNFVKRKDLILLLIFQLISMCVVRKISIQCRHC